MKNKKINILLIVASLILLVAALASCSESPCADGHTYGEPEVLRAPTCRDSGEYRYVCSGCGSNYTEIVNSIDHIFVDNCCTMCNAFTNGNIDFALNSDGASYKILKCRDPQITEFEVPATFNGKPVTVIGECSFSDVRTLEKIIIPSSVVEIERAAFSTCHALTDVELSEGLKIIGESAFSSCITLEAITIPATVESIGDNAFLYCYELKSLELPESVTSIGSSMLIGTLVEEITVPAGVTVIPDEAFRGADHLKTVTLLGEIESIGSGAFSNSSIEKVSAKGTPVIADKAFAYASSLYILDIPDGVSNIGVNAFESCRSLHSITLSKDLTSIGDNAFYGCDRLLVIYNLSSLAINSQNNPGNINAKARYVLNTVPETDLVQYVNDFAVIVTTGTITEKGEEKVYKNFLIFDYIGHDRTPEFPVFEDTEEYTVGSYTIAKYTFYSMGGYEENILFADLPEGLTCIEEHAFFNCDTLLRIYVPQSVKDPNKYFYTNTEALVEVISCCGDFVPNKTTGDEDYLYMYKQVSPGSTVDSYSSLFKIDDYIVTIYKDTVYVLGYDGDSTDIRLPEVPTGTIVSNYVVGRYAFALNTIDSLSMPDTVTKIDHYAFQGKNDLTEFTFPSSLKYIGTNAFAYAIFGDIVLPDSVEFIGSSAFKSATFNSMKLPIGAEMGPLVYNFDEDGYCYIDNVLVSVDSNKVSGDITVKAGTVQLASDLFSSESYNVSSVVIPEGVLYIGRYVFSSNYNLKTVVVPKSVIRIEDGFVTYCYNLEKIVYNGTIEDWKTIARGVRISDGEYVIQCVEGTYTLPGTLSIEA